MSPADGSTPALGVTIPKDLARIGRLILTMRDPAFWNKDHNCDPKNPDKKCLSQRIYDLEMTDLAEHILYAAYQITGKGFETLWLFNDDKQTDHRVLTAVLYQARDNIYQGVVAKSFRLTVRSSPEPWGEYFTRIMSGAFKGLSSPMWGFPALG